MLYYSQRSTVLTLVAALIVAGTQHPLMSEGGAPTPGMDQINNILDTQPEKLCYYVNCQDPLDATHCKNDTVYVEGVAQFGCCGACVRFKQRGEKNCTGSIDPRFGGGYNLSRPQTMERNLKSTIIIPGYQPVDNILHSQWCDYYLNCEDGICKPSDSVRGCRYVQEKYDEEVKNNGSFIWYRDDYRWRPDCTPDGHYTYKQCKGPNDERRCVCVDPDGNSIYGKAFPWQRELYENMNCRCSRKVWERLQSGETTVTLHCQENGNYEELQCEKGWCYCIDPDTATPYGHTLPNDIMFLLPCYNETTVGAQYLRTCESEYFAHATIINDMRAHGVQGPTTLLQCDPDGSYSGEQCDFYYDTCRCHDKYNNIIQYPSGGGCNCARDRWLYYQNHIPIVVLCMKDGSTAGVYSQMQRRGAYSFCVDSDGVRAGPLVYSTYEEQLNCTAAVVCQSGEENEPKACKNACFRCKPEAFVKYMFSIN